MRVRTKCLLAIERSGHFSTPPSRKRSSRAERRGGEEERQGRSNSSVKEGKSDDKGKWKGSFGL